MSFRRYTSHTLGVDLECLDKNVHLELNSSSQNLNWRGGEGLYMEIKIELELSSCLHSFDFAERGDSG